MRHASPWPSVLALAFAAAALATVTSVSAAFADASATHTESVATEHFDVRYRPDSWAGAAADGVGAAAERDLARIRTALALESAEQRFTLFLYDDDAEMRLICKRPDFSGWSAGTEVHVPYDNAQTRFHELVHVVAHTLKPTGKEPRGQFHAEGLSNALLEYVDGIHVHAVAAYRVARKEVPPIAELADGDFYAWCGEHIGLRPYDLAGSFYRYLIDTHGIEAVKRWYTGTPAKEAFEKDVPALDAAWRAMLSKYRVRPEVAKRLEVDAGAASGFEPYSRGLPVELLGKPGDWTSLLAGERDPDDAAKWKKDGKGLRGLNPATDWTICRLGKDEYDDCAVRATIRTKSFCAVQVRIGAENQAMLVGPGTFLFRGSDLMKQSKGATMGRDQATTDFVVVRRGAEVEVWIDGVRILKAKSAAGKAPIGVGVAQGEAVFEEVRVRRL